MTDWIRVRAPSIDEFVHLAEDALTSLPDRFREMAGDVQMRVLDFPEEEMLDDLGIEDPFELTGLYQGVDLSRRSVSDPVPMPSMVMLFRRPILDEWCERGDVPLGELISHVLVHEIGHHFGLSDAAIEAIERDAR